jgi:hypothetical protein
LTKAYCLAYGYLGPFTGAIPLLFNPDWKPEEKTTEEWRTIIDRAADLIEKGWTKGNYHIEKRGWFGRVHHSYCMVGAIRAAAMETVRAETPDGERLSAFRYAELYNQATVKVAQMLTNGTVRNEADAHGRITTWNDSSSRTKDEVLSVMHKAVEAE